MKYKICSKCKQKKPATSEYFYKRGEGSLRNYCKICSRNRDRDRKYYYSTKGRITFREKYLKATYGISLKQYDEMFDLQQGCCAICDEPEIEFRRLSIDHNHNTGKVRGLLCLRCNARLSIVEDVNFVKAAKRYLNKYNN